MTSIRKLVTLSQETAAAAQWVRRSKMCETDMIKPELLRKVAEAIGDISARNSGVIGHPLPLRSAMSVQMIEEIARTAIKTMLDWLELKS